MRNLKPGCLVFGILALLVIMFFNGGGGGSIEMPSEVGVDGSGTAGSGGDGSAAGGSGGLEPLEPLEGLDGDGDGSGEGVSLELEGDGSDGSGSGGDGSGGMLEGEIDAQVSDVNYTVLGANNMGDSIETLQADGDFVVVELLIENTGDDPLTYFGANMIDDHGQEYSYVSDALPYIVDEEACEVVVIEPGEERVCTMVYDINDDANAVGIILTDLNLLGGEESIVELAGLP